MEGFHRQRGGRALKGLVNTVMQELHAKLFSRDRCLLEMDLAALLERQVIPLQSAETKAVLRKKVIVVTGAAGSIGSELCRQLLEYEPGMVIALDTNETGLFDLVNSLRSHANGGLLFPFIGDIKDVPRMSRFFAEVRPQVIFHAAAYKHVPLLEQFPDQAVQTNALATYHLCHLAQEYRVECFVYISSDKAAAPISVLGASKRLGELIVQSFAHLTEGSTQFCAVRFGNVIGSRGSVVPIFAQQIESGGPVTVTDPEATRYFMTIPEACDLVIITSAIAGQGGLYMLDMGKPVRILDLAIKMIRLHGLREEQDIQIVYTGLRPGERLHETLVARNEHSISTVHDKILRVVNNNDLPPHSTIAQWMLILDESLQHESLAQLRERLFEMVQVHELVKTK